MKSEFKELCTEIIEEFSHEPNTEETRDKVKKRFEEELGDDFVIACSKDNNPPHAVELGILLVDIFNTKTRIVTTVIIRKNDVNIYDNSSNLLL